MDAKIDQAARAYIAAATDLADAMLAKLQREAPDIAAKANQQLERGERLQLVLEFSPDNPRIVWQTVDDYEKPKRLMCIPGRMPTRQ